MCATPNALLSSEVYNPRTHSFMPAANMVVPRISHAASLLADGEVLITGGICEESGGTICGGQGIQSTPGGFDGTNVRGAAELYTP